MKRHLKHSRFGASLMAVALGACMIEAADAATAGAPREPVWYIVKEKSLIGNEIHEAGAKVQYDGLPSENLEPTCDEGRARHQEYLRSNAERVAKMREQYSESGVGDPAKFAADFAKALAEQQAQHTAQMAALVEQNNAMAAKFTDALAQLTGALQNISVAPAAAPANPAAPAGEAAAAKPAGRAKADKPATDGDGLV